MKFNKIKVFIEPIISASDFYSWIKCNEHLLNFTQEEFHNKMVEDMFSEGKLSGRYDQQWCEEVINKDENASISYWDPYRKYYPAIYEFMKLYKLETARFVQDW